MMQIKFVYLIAAVSLAFASSCSKSEDRKKNQSEIEGEITLSTTPPPGYQEGEASANTAKPENQSAQASGESTSAAKPVISPADGARVNGATTSEAVSSGATAQQAPVVGAMAPKTPLSASSAPVGAASSVGFAQPIRKQFTPPQPEAEIKDLASWKFSEIRITDQKTIRDLSGAVSLSLFENSLVQNEIVEAAIEKNGFGLSCKFHLTGKLQNADKLQFASAKSVPISNTKKNGLLVLFTNDTSKLMSVCTYQGGLNEFFFKDALKDVIDFKTPEGQFRSEQTQKLSAHALIEKMKTFQISDVNKFAKLVVGSQTSDVEAVIRGGFVSEGYAGWAVAHGREKIACSVKSISKTVINRQLFNLVRRDIQEDLGETYSKVVTQYDSQDGTQVVTECFQRKNGVDLNDYADTWNGILEFGVKEQK